MLLSIYSIYDSKTETYSTPFFSPNNNVALRSYHQLLNDPQSTLHHFPKDFSLFLIGIFDDIDASITPKTTPIPITDELSSSNT